jgi:hypothetical protein
MFSNVYEKPVGKKFARSHGWKHCKAGRAPYKRANRRAAKRYENGLAREYNAGVVRDWEFFIRRVHFSYR